MKGNEFIIKNIKSNGNFTKVELNNGKTIILRPFLYLKPNDVLKFIPSIDNYEKIYKVFEDKATREIKEVKIYPPYEKRETIYLPPHKFEVIFRERKDVSDWEKVKDLERFHYRGKGLNKIVGRRTVLLAEIPKVGIVGFGVLSASVAVCAPRFRLLGINFTEQMKSGLINRIVRIPRIVIHPEFRGLNLGVLMAKHLINYAREYWDINHYTPIMIEVIAAMTEYHRFFEKAGFIKIGYTTGYKGVAIIPKYGEGCFAERNFSKYKFIENQREKPYLVYPLSSKIEEKLKPYRESHKILFAPKSPKLTDPLKFKNLSLKYKIKNGSTERTNIVKEVFGVDSDHAFSPVIENFSLTIEPGDVVLITGASGSGKSTLLKLLTTSRNLLKDTLEWSGVFPQIKNNMVEVLNVNSFCDLPLIDQLGKDVKEAINLLNSVGLTEAHLYIKKPHQLSDGQRYRFAIAKLCDSKKPIWVADEFASTLNPEMAAIVAKGLRKLAYKYGATVIIAAPHISYFVDSLLPNKLVKLSWSMKPRICSIKITKFSQNNDKLTLSIKNNGSEPLSKIEIGLLKTSKFHSLYKVQFLNPQELITTTIKIIEKEFYALIIKAGEGVGEIFYYK
jgi:ABC-type lipoprotein export system ATPase subunit/GNAT superfamily N-acetyltransferase